MRAGRLRDKITIQQPSVTVDSVGEAVTTWSDFITRRASVTPFRSNEFVKFDQEQVETRVVFSLRYVTGITNKMRIVLSGKYYDIISIVDDENRHRELFITAMERSYD